MKNKIRNVFQYFRNLKPYLIIAYRKSTNIPNMSIKDSHGFFYENHKTQNLRI